jgi:hypothetical protein
MKLQFLWEPYCYILFSTITWKVIPQNLQSTHICFIVTHMVPYIWMMHLAFILQTCLNQNNHILLLVLKLCLTGFHLLTDFFKIPTVMVFRIVLASAHWARMKGPLMTGKHQHSGILFTDSYIVILDILPRRGNLNADHDRGWVFSTWMRLWLCYSKDMDRYTVGLRPQAFASRTQCLTFRPQALYYRMVNCKLLACRWAVQQSLKEY